MASPDEARKEYTILIAGDSRVSKLKDYIDRIMATSVFKSDQYSFEVICVPGGTFDRVVETAIWKCERRMYQQVYLFAGICDLSTRSGSLWMPKFHDCGVLLDYLKRKSEVSYNKLKCIGELVIINELVGMDISAYNKFKLRANTAQFTIDNTLPGFNRWVHRFLTSANPLLNAPYYAAYIYKFRRGKMTPRYELATADGLHYNVFFMNRFAMDIAKNVQYNRALIHGHTIKTPDNEHDIDYDLERSHDSGTSSDFPEKQGWSD